MQFHTKGMAQYVSRQLAHMFPDNNVSQERLDASISTAYERTMYCLRRLKTFDLAFTSFNHLYSDHYLIFLYFYGNQLFRDNGHCVEATKIYYLNKALHSFDAYYEIELPEVFAVSHGVGTVLGRARYGDFLYVYQNVTVGVGLNGEQPDIGSAVVLFPGSKIIGQTRLAGNNLVAVGSVIINREVPKNHLIAGNGGPIMKPTRRDVRTEFFR